MELAPPEVQEWSSSAWSWSHAKRDLYADSLDSGRLQIPTTKPRVAAWTNKLLHEVIRLDTNHDGSFGDNCFLICLFINHLVSLLFLKNKLPFELR